MTLGFAVILGIVIIYLTSTLHWLTFSDHSWKLRPIELRDAEFGRIFRRFSVQEAPLRILLFRPLVFEVFLHGMANISAPMYVHFSLKLIFVPFWQKLLLCSRFSYVFDCEFNFLIRARFPRFQANYEAKRFTPFQQPRNASVWTTDRTCVKFISPCYLSIEHCWIHVPV